MLMDRMSEIDAFDPSGQTPVSAEHDAHKLLNLVSDNNNSLSG